MCGMFQKMIFKFSVRPLKKGGIAVCEFISIEIILSPCSQ